MDMTRRAFLAAGAVAAGAVVVDALALEPRRITVTRHRPSPREGPLWRLAQVSDLHLDRLDDHARRTADAVAELEPHAIALTGDQVNGAHALPALAAFAERLGGAPIMAILGNWERGADLTLAEVADALAGAGGRLLVNETATLAHAGRRIEITGLDDFALGRPDLAEALTGGTTAGAATAGAAMATTAIAGAAPRPALRILLEHCPAYRDRLLAGSGFDVMLAGHTHGGQVTLFGWAPIRPRGSGRYVAGWYRDADPPMYVSRGIGTTLVPVRFMAPPEIAVFEWGLGE